MLDYKKINVGIIDLGINNIFSILQLFKDLKCTTEIYNKKDKKKYNLIVLPGVGSFNEAMKIIKREKLDKDIIELSKDKSKIILGICLGMQLFFEQSNEFVKTKGLSLIKGSVKKLSNKVNVKTHIGWKKIYAKQKVFNNLDTKLFYFVHSYFCEVEDNEKIIFKTKIGNFNFASGVIKDNLIGLQFHPEKSGKVGMKLIKKLIKKIK